MTRGVGGESPANVLKYIHGQHFPAKKQDLISTANHNHAPHEVLEVLKELREEEYHGPQEVLKAYGEVR